MAATPRPSRAKYFMWWLNLLGRLVSQNPVQNHVLSHSEVTLCGWRGVKIQGPATRHTRYICLHFPSYVYTSLCLHFPSRNRYQGWLFPLHCASSAVHFTVHHLQSSSLYTISSPLYCAPSPVHFTVHYLHSSSSCLHSSALRQNMVLRDITNFSFCCSSLEH